MTRCGAEARAALNVELSVDASELEESKCLGGGISEDEPVANANYRLMGTHDVARRCSSHRGLSEPFNSRYHL
jgi:hypothetical protein